MKERRFQKKNDTQENDIKNQKEKRCSQAHRPQQGSDNPKTNLRTTILKKETTLSKENDMQKTTSKQKKKNDAHKLTDHSKDLRNHRSLNRRI
jgi:hypothetical protein